MRAIDGQVAGGQEQNNHELNRYGAQTNQGSSNNQIDDHRLADNIGKRTMANNMGGHPSDLNDETYTNNARNQKTPAVIVQDDVYSSDFLNAKQSNKSIKLINIENNKQQNMRMMDDKSYKEIESSPRRVDILSPNTNMEASNLSDKHDLNELKVTDYERLPRNQAGAMSAQNSKKTKVQIMYFDHKPDGNRSNDQDDDR